MKKPTEWEKIFSNIFDKRLVSRNYKELLQLTIKKTNIPIKKQAKDLNNHVSKENTQIANKHVKRYSTSLVIREMQIKTTRRYHVTPTRMIIKIIIIIKENNKCW